MSSEYPIKPKFDNIIAAVKALRDMKFQIDLMRDEFGKTRQVIKLDLSLLQAKQFVEAIIDMAPNTQYFKQKHGSVTKKYEILREDMEFALNRFRNYNESEE